MLADTQQLVGQYFWYFYAPAGKKKSLADYAIVRRIHFIFERTVRRFRSDLALWTAWLEFCRASSSNRRLGRVVGRALQVRV